jgi:hypothetical protein
VKSQLSRGIARLKEQAAGPEPTELTALADRLTR